MLILFLYLQQICYNIYMLTKDKLHSFKTFCIYILKRLTIRTVLVCIFHTLTYILYVLVGTHILEIVYNTIEYSMTYNASFLYIITNEILNPNICIYWLLIWMTIIIFSEILGAYSEYLAGTIYAKSEYYIRTELVEYLHKIKSDNIKKMPGEAVIENYIDLLAEGVREFVEKMSHDIIPAAIFILVTLIYIFFHVSCVVGSLLGIWIASFFALQLMLFKRTLSFTKNVAQYSSERTNTIVEVLKNMNSSKDFQAIDYSINKVQDIHQIESNNYTKYVQTTSINTGFSHIINSICRLSILLLIIFSGVIRFHGIASIVKIQTSISLVSWVMYTIWEKTQDIVEVNQSIAQSRKALSFLQQFETDQKPNKHHSKKYDINICDISIKHNEQDDYIIKDLSIKIAEGDMVAITGQSGIGKSTILNLITKHLACTSGTISIGQQDINTLNDQQISDKFTYLNQNDYLFDDTIRNNITLGRPHTNEEYQYAIQISGLQSLIEKVTDDFRIGKNGIKISGGEKRRISIARAYLKTKPIVILDEMNTGIDPITYKNIFANILKHKHKHNTTIIIIDHFNTLNHKCNNIIFLQKNKAPIINTHQNLLDTCPEYYNYLHTLDNLDD